MPIFPVRGIAKYGILTDPDPYDLPVGAWSLGVNVRFRNARITRGPVFRNLGHLGTVSPRFSIGVNPTSGQDATYIGYMNGTVSQFSNGTETDRTLSGYTPASLEANWTGTRLADIFYLNRSDRPPWYIRSTDTLFQNLYTGGGSAWASNWTTQLLRSSNGALIAFNVTKGGTTYPTMVKTSSFPLSGVIPASWDQTSPTTNATENILAEMEGAIIDAQSLGNLMFIYGQNETWLMQFVGGTFLWNYTKAFSNRGVLNSNCVVEVNKMHVVFGYDDIWVHDGVSNKSICNERTRDFIYSGLNVARANRCFVVHNADLKEILFCYCSGDTLSQFGVGTVDACNRAATWNYDDDIWTFDDLPLVFSGTRANIDTTLTWAAATTSGVTWSQIGGSWGDLGTSGKRSTLFLGDTNATYSLTKSLYAFDPTGPLSKVANAIDNNATKGLYLERDGIDLDDVGAKLTGYKVLRTMYPEGRLDSLAIPISFNAGSSDGFNVPATFVGYQTWDGNTLYKLDYNTAGRYLALRVSFNDVKFMSLSGFDVDVVVTGQR